MAVIASQLYFRFPIWPRLTFRKVKSYWHTKFQPDISMAEIGYYYFRFLKTNVRHIEILLPVSLLTFSLSSTCGFHRHTEFHRNRIIRGGVMTLWRFLRWRPCSVMFSEPAVRDHGAPPDPSWLGTDTRPHETPHLASKFSRLRRSSLGASV